MKREKISAALGQINPDYIREAEQYRARKATWKNWSAVAASFAILLLTGVLLIHSLINGAGTDPYWTPNNTEEGILAERKLSVFTDPQYAAYTALRVIDEADVGEKIADTEIRSFWRNYLFQKDTDIEILRAEIYAIKGIAPEIAVCIRYLDQGDALTTSHYYTYINTEYQPESPMELYRVLSVSKGFSVASYITLSFPSEKGTVYAYHALNTDLTTALDFPEARFFAAHNDKSFAAAEADLLKDCTAQASFSAELTLAGTVTHRVLDNGYLCIRLNEDLTYIFEISAKDTDAFFRYIDHFKVEKDEPDETVIGTTRAITE